MKAPPLPLWRMTRVRFDRLVDVGIFGPEDRVELLDGLLVAREPQGRRHAAVVVLVRAALEKAFGSAYHVREEKPIALEDQSEPEPDAVVVPGQPRDYLDAHPSRPALIVEVAETSLAIDRLRKGSLYARAEIAEFWVVNLVDKVDDPVLGDLCTRVQAALAQPVDRERRLGDLDDQGRPGRMSVQVVSRLARHDDGVRLGLRLVLER